MKLVSARICADCDEVYDEDIDGTDKQRIRCPACGSMFYLRLAPILNREETHGKING